VTGNEDILVCDRCSATRQVLWAPAFDEYLCAECRQVKSYKVLDEVVTPLPVAEAGDGESPFDTSFLAPDECELCNRPSPWHQMMCTAATYGFTPHEFLGLPSMMREIL